MLRTMLKSKIHRATVTEANVEYEGSVTIDADLMRAANILPYEQVQIYDCTNASRLTTYAIPGERGSGILCVNGAAARLVHVGDTVIVIAYAQLDDAEARAFHPSVVFVDDANRIVETGHDPGHAPDGSHLRTAARPMTD